ncbi:WD40/YVTN/BNR-like repeat-containing protein [Legionella feeleii]|nr:hypothetical protein [Legionella feeleii]
MKVKRILIKTFQLILCSFLLFPAAGFAHHLIAITAISPFPSSIPTSATATASFRVTNMTSRVPLTVIDQSYFPSSSGLSILSSSCGSLIGPGQSCTITLQFQAPSTPRIISAELREWAKPSADAIRFPFTIAVVRPPTFTITGSAGAGGAISPNTPQTVNSGGSIMFTAAPSAGFAVSQWFLDGILVQSGGLTYTLSNITADHTVQVTFFSGLIAVGNYTNTSVIRTPLIFLSATNGSAWSPITTSLPPDFANNGSLAASSCTGINCIAAGVYNNGVTNRPLILFSSDAGSSWNSVTAPVPVDFVSSAVIMTTTCELTTCVAAGAYSNGAVIKALILVSNSSGESWFAANPVLPADFLNLASLNSATCTGTTCVAAGTYMNVLNIQLPLLLVSHNSGASWVSVTPTLSPTFSDLGTINSVTCEGTVCIATGFFFDTLFQGLPLILVSNDLGNSWNFVTPSLPGDFSNFGFFNAVACTGSVCNGAGNYNDGVVTQPLFFHSTDTGATWSSVNATTLPPNFSDIASLRSITCIASNCIAAGDYADAGSIFFPMLFVSSNQGASWTSFGLTVPADFADSGGINALTCSGTICTAVGQYTNTSNIQIPLIYVSSDSGITWSSVPPTLPADFADLGVLSGTAGTL